MPPASPVTAAAVLIGNELLSGRTHDKNLPFLAEGLNAAGVRLREARIIADDEATIVETVNTLRAQYHYVFTSGGIGPTHDDITTASIARAFGVSAPRHPEAVALLDAYYGERATQTRLKMAEIPEGASLILNPVSAAPGYRMDNVFVMAGVPSIFRAMFDEIKGTLRGGAPMHTRSVSGMLPEGDVAAEVGIIQTRFPDVDIGSYPFIRQGKAGVNLVARGIHAHTVDTAHDALYALLEARKAEIVE